MDKYAVGDIVKLKKPHPCGSSEWEILRVGADFRLKCMDAAIWLWFRGSLWKKTTGVLQRKNNSLIYASIYSGINFFNN